MEQPKQIFENKYLEQQQIPQPEEYINKLREHGHEDLAEVYAKVIEISQAIKEAGGQALLVGGCVRDIFFNKISKDFDIEIYKLQPEQIEEIVSKFGKVSDVGKAFGILKIAFGQGIDIDVSLPRRDSKIGAGHKGFEIKADPDMSIEDAAKRRDFTINSMAADPLTGELHDPYNGLEDVKNRVLRITDEERFQDDPLRIMRALQFMGRFGLKLDRQSAKLIQQMAPQLKELPEERILEEWKKLLLKSDKPSLGLMAGMSLGVLDEIHPSFPPMAKTPQDREWHPEGDTWIHTLMAVDKAAEITKREDLPAEESLVVLFSTLCHDLGKPETTKIRVDEKGNARVISHGHEPEGEEPTKKFLNEIKIDNKTRDKVISCVKNHLIPTVLFTEEEIKENKVSDGAIRRLAKRIHPATIQELVLVAEADHLGRGPFSDPEVPEQALYPDSFPAGPWLIERARKLKVEDSKPADLLMGRDLINLELKPGLEFGQIIKLANDLRDDKEMTKEQVLQAIYDSKDAKEALAKLKKLK
ncbi:CCA tRNA nucleotidyltransferase [Patescibacteria group bacterium]